MNIVDLICTYDGASDFLDGLANKRQSQEAKTKANTGVLHFVQDDDVGGLG
jgi:hypothetical protein